LVTEPGVSPLCGARRAPPVDVPVVDLGFPDELVEPVGGSPPVDDGDPVVDSLEPEAFPGGSDAVGEPPETSAPPAEAVPPDGDVFVEDPVFGESVCVVPDVESPEPVVSATATVGVEAIAAPTPSATANAPTRPT
jgi:hypothetical protein